MSQQLSEKINDPISEETVERLKELAELEYKYTIRRAELIRDMKMTCLNSNLRPAVRGIDQHLLIVP